MTDETGVVQVDEQEAAARFTQILAAAERGEDVVIIRAGKPVVRLVPMASPAPREVGFVSGSVPAAFFEPLPDHELARWE